MAIKRTCVHDRPKDRGPIITPQRSWCFFCDDGGMAKSQNNGWKPARPLSAMMLMDLEREVFPPAMVLDEPVEVAMPRRVQV